MHAARTPCRLTPAPSSVPRTARPTPKPRALISPWLLMCQCRTPTPQHNPPNHHSSQPRLTTMPLLPKHRWSRVHQRTQAHPPCMQQCTAGLQPWVRRLGLLCTTPPPSHTVPLRQWLLTTCLLLPSALSLIGPVFLCHRAVLPRAVLLCPGPTHRLPPISLRRLLQPRQSTQTNAGTIHPPFLTRRLVARHPCLLVCVGRWFTCYFQEAYQPPPPITNPLRPAATQPAPGMV